MNSIQAHSETVEGNLPVDVEAFLDDLQELRTIGAYRTGVHRPTYSASDMEARRWLMERMVSVGLEPTLDGIGNVFGRNKMPGKHVLVGSHIESQNYAGWLDGALGVMAGIALARAGLPVDVCAFADEESHFTGPFLGSRSFVGDLSEDDIDKSTSNHGGPRLRDALKLAGLSGRDRLKMEEERYGAFFEMHIEQGTQLEKSGNTVGVVTAIIGGQRWELNFKGRQDHAGATAMNERADAGLSAVRFLAALDQEFPRVCSPYSVWTTCNIVLSPGVPGSIVPGEARVWLEFRDTDANALQAMESTLKKMITESNRREPCVAAATNTTNSDPVVCDSHLLEALRQSAAEHAPDAWMDMPSRGGHDAKILATKLPTAMLFVPSIGGISHHWTEDTKLNDLSTGIRVLHDAVEKTAIHLSVTG